MNEFLEILNSEGIQEGNQNERLQQEQRSQNTRNKDSSLKDSSPETQDQYWKNVLSNAYFLSYPGLDGKHKKYDPLRPLWVLLQGLREMGAALTKVKKSDGSEHFKLEQGNIPGEKWQDIRTNILPGQRDKLLWLFTVSMMGGATKEGYETAERLFREMVNRYAGKNAGKGLTKDLEAAGQMKMFSA